MSGQREIKVSLRIKDRAAAKMVMSRRPFGRSQSRSADVAKTKALVEGAFFGGNQEGQTDRRSQTHREPAEGQSEIT